MKRCFKCGETKPLDDFYKHKMMADGHLGKCKDCSKSDAKLYREAKLDYCRAYDAWRYENDPRAKERNKRYSQTERGKETIRLNKKKWMANNPDKRAAHVILNNAVRGGRVHKPSHCSVCGNDHKIIHGHHDDYAKPLDVVWCCPSCHKNIHDN